MGIFRRVFSLFLAAALLISALPVSAFAAMAEDSAETEPTDAVTEEITVGDMFQTQPTEESVTEETETVTEATIPVEPEEQLREMTNGDVPEILESDNWQYCILGENTVAVCGYIRTSEKEEAAYLEIPSEIAGKAVVKIAEYAFADCESICTIFIPDSVSAIGKSAFENCGDLRAIAVCGAAVSFDSTVAANCEKLEKLFALSELDASDFVEVFTADLGEDHAASMEYLTFDDLDALKDSYNSYVELLASQKEPAVAPTVDAKQIPQKAMQGTRQRLPGSHTPQIPTLVVLLRFPIMPQQLRVMSVTIGILF